MKSMSKILLFIIPFQSSRSIVYKIFIDDFKYSVYKIDVYLKN
jgi:hypothetical protein